MTPTKRALHEIVQTRAMHLNAVVQGLTTGLVTGLGLFVATNWLILKGGEPVGPHLALLGQFFIGYRVTFLGSLIGFGYAFAIGYFIGYLVARLYNRIVDWKETSRDGRAPSA
jgi:hypothetical protein